MKIFGCVLIFISLFTSNLLAATPRSCPRVMGPQGDWPLHLSNTGIYADLKSATFAPGFFDYEVNVPLWTSGSEKKRSVCVPGENFLNISKSGEIDFPEGTILIKEFSYRLESGHEQKLETRVQILVQGNWLMKTYRWSNAQDEGSRIDSYENVELATAEKAHWEYLTTPLCTTCHQVSGNPKPLGFTAAQLNKGTQIDSFIKNGLLDSQVKSAELPAYPELTNPRLTSYEKTRHYLAVNCAVCHRPGGMMPSMDLRLETPLASMKIVGVAPHMGDLGIPDAKRIKPFEHEKSILWRRIESRGQNHMPRFGGDIPDPEALRFIGEWIDAGALENH